MVTSSPGEKAKWWDIISGGLQIHIFPSSSTVSLIADCYLILAIHCN